MNNFSINSKCLCGSGNKYKKCCQLFHKGAIPKLASQLMRSRYCAFALKIPQYIIKTTHKENQDYKEDTLQWKNEILDFCETCIFKKLDILEFIDGKKESFVTFKAEIYCDNNNSSFTEKSRFFKVNNKWLYHSGEFIS